MNVRHVGKIKDAHGLKGELYVLIFSGDVTWLSELKEFYLEKIKSNEEKEKYILKNAKPHKQGFIAKVEGIEDRTKAESLKGLNFFIGEELLISKPGESIYLSEIEGFSVLDSGNLIGKIEGFSSNGAQDLLLVETEKGQKEIPFVEEFVVKIDFNNSEIFMKLPFGLLGEEED